MKKHSKINIAIFSLIALFSASLVSCNKENSSNRLISISANPIKIGLIASKGLATDNVGYTYYQTDIQITNIGNQTVNYQIIFDTGSGGLVVDAEGLIPASMITTNGFSFSGDSTIVNCITITNQPGTIKYGANAATTNTVYGNLAYAQVTVGDQNGSVAIKRLPFFLYYKAVDANNHPYNAHEFDVFGSSEIYDYMFPNKVNLTTPFSFCTLGSGLTKGFKMAAIAESQFTPGGNYVKGAITVGLTSDDLAPSSGFVLNPISLTTKDGYFPFVLGTVNYNSATFSSHLLFDSGTNFCSVINDPNYVGSGASLVKPNTTINFNTNSGFNYNFTVTNTTNLSFVQYPQNRFNESILGIQYFFKNEYLLDLTNHQIGLKVN